MTMSLIGENMENGDLSVLGAGFACIDIIRFRKEDTVMLGGTAANVMTILSVLGLETEFLTAKYIGISGEYIESALTRRGIKCISFTNAKKQVPRIVEEIEEKKHFFITTCPKCGRNLVKCNLPTWSQMAKVEKQFNRSPNVFFFDRISEGIKEFAEQNNKGWNVYEPNSCRMYTNLISGMAVADIVKYSEDRISAKLTDNVIRDIRDTKVALLIVTMGNNGIKFVTRTETGDFSDWNYISAVSIDNEIDTSGSGDWLSGVFIYLLLRKYPNYTFYLDEQYIEQILNMAQKYAAQNCSFIGAQGMLENQKIIDKINSEFNKSAKLICDSEINWEYDCDFCYNEHIDN